MKTSSISVDSQGQKPSKTSHWYRMIERSFKLFRINKHLVRMPQRIWEIQGSQMSMFGFPMSSLRLANFPQFDACTKKKISHIYLLLESCLGLVFVSIYSSPLQCHTIVLYNPQSMMGRIGENEQLSESIRSIWLGLRGRQQIWSKTMAFLLLENLCCCNRACDAFRSL